MGCDQEAIAASGSADATWRPGWFDPQVVAAPLQAGDWLRAEPLLDETVCRFEGVIIAGWT
jgi:hypothetical protein